MQNLVSKNSINIIFVYQYVNENFYINIGDFVSVKKEVPSISAYELVSISKGYSSVINISTNNKYVIKYITLFDYITILNSCRNFSLNLHLTFAGN